MSTMQENGSPVTFGSRHFMGRGLSLRAVHTVGISKLQKGPSQGSAAGAAEAEGARKAKESSGALSTAANRARDTVLSFQQVR